MSELRAGRPVVVGEVEIVPLEEVWRAQQVTETGYAVAVYVRPAAVLAIGPKQTRAFDTEGVELDAEEISSQIFDSNDAV